MRTSIDKCSGESCICKMNLKPIRVIRSARIESISLNHLPGPFPGAGGMSIQFMDTTPRTPPPPQMDALILTVEAYQRMRERR